MHGMHASGLGSFVRVAKLHAQSTEQRAQWSTEHRVQWRGRTGNVQRAQARWEVLKHGRECGAKVVAEGPAREVHAFDALHALPNHPLQRCRCCTLRRHGALCPLWPRVRWKHRTAACAELAVLLRRGPVRCKVQQMPLQHACVSVRGRHKWSRPPTAGTLL
jgi:hypothetical protein